MIFVRNAELWNFLCEVIANVVSTYEYYVLVRFLQINNVNTNNYKKRFIKFEKNCHGSMIYECDANINLFEF